jgi:uncharacterized MnhB-related membrane protein
MSLLADTVPLQALVCVLSALAATAVVFTRRPLRQIVVSGIYGLVFAITFFVLQAPDVALSMLVVSTIAYPVIVLAAISRVRRQEDRKEK